MNYKEILITALFVASMAFAAFDGSWPAVGVFFIASCVFILLPFQPKEPVKIEDHDAVLLGKINELADDLGVLQARLGLKHDR